MQAAPEPIYALSDSAPGLPSSDSHDSLPTASSKHPDKGAAGGAAAMLPLSAEEAGRPSTAGIAAQGLTADTQTEPVPSELPPPQPGPEPPEPTLPRKGAKAPAAPPQFKYLGFDTPMRKPQSASAERTHG